MRFFFTRNENEYIMNLDEMRDIKNSFNIFIKFIDSEYINFSSNNNISKFNLKERKNFVSSEKLKYINENMNNSKLNKQSFYDIWKKFLNSKSMDYKTRSIIFKIFFSVSFGNVFKSYYKIIRPKLNNDYFNNKIGNFFNNYLYNLKNEKYDKKNYAKNPNNFNENLSYLYLPIWYQDESYISLKYLIETSIEKLNNKYHKLIKNKDYNYLKFNDDHFLFMMQNYYFKFNDKFTSYTLLPIKQYRRFNSRYIFEFFPRINTEVFHKNENLTFEKFNKIYISKQLLNGEFNKKILWEGLNSKSSYILDNEEYYNDNIKNELKKLKLSYYEIKNIYSIIENLKYFITDYYLLTKLKLPINKNNLYIFDFSPKFWKFNKNNIVSKLGKRNIKPISDFLNIKLKFNKILILDKKKFDEISDKNNMLYFSKIFNLNMNTLFFEIFYIIKLVDLMKSKILNNIKNFELKPNLSSIKCSLKKFNKKLLKVYGSFPIKKWDILTIEINGKYIKILNFFRTLIIKNEQDLMNSPIKLKSFYDLELNSHNLNKNKELKNSKAKDLGLTFENYGFILFFREIVEYSIYNKNNSFKMKISNYFISLYTNTKNYILGIYKRIYGRGLHFEDLVDFFVIIREVYGLVINLFFLHVAIALTIKDYIISNIEEFIIDPTNNSKIWYHGLVIKSIIDQLYYLKYIFGFSKFDSKLRLDKMIIDDNLFYVDKNEFNIKNSNNNLLKNLLDWI